MSLRCLLPVCSRLLGDMYKTCREDCSVSSADTVITRLNVSRGTGCNGGRLCAGSTSMSILRIRYPYQAPVPVAQLLSHSLELPG